MSDCLFCKIGRGEIPSKKAYEDDTVLAFYDIDPKAPVHVLVIPKKHIESAHTVAAEDAALLPAGVGRAAADAYRTLRHEQHRARLNEEPTRVPDSELAAEQGAVLALWHAVFG